MPDEFVARQQGRLGPPASNRDFVPGESTKLGQHAVEATVIAAPFVAYALSYAIDHRLHYHNAGIWKRSNQLDLEHGIIAAEVAGAFWLGGQSRLGRTFWRAADSSIFTAGTTFALKHIFARSRPRQTADPHKWFQGGGHVSFPSGEVAFQASFVTPFIAEYRHTDPWVWSLEALPLYDAIARMKTHGHWQTDVLAGWAIGSAWGIYAHFEGKPLVLSIMPHGVMVGWHTDF